MAMYLHIVTNGDAALKSEILGYTAADAQRVKDIEAKYRAILADQRHPEWSAAYDAQERELTATPALGVASVYETYGFGKIEAWKAVEHITAGHGRGACEGDLAIAVLEEQRFHFDAEQCANDAHMLAALNRAIAAARAGRVSVCWA